MSREMSKEEMREVRGSPKEVITEDSQDGKLRILPDELVEKILARVPFPHVFKARTLSKSWLARLSPISSEDDKDKKRLAISFQKQIRQYSTNWKAFCPVHYFSKDDHLIAAYDQSSHSWQRLPSFSFLYEALGYGPIQFSQVQSRRRRGHMMMEGALLFCVIKEELYVANILTQQWKQLPPRPCLGEDRSCLVPLRPLIFSQTSETYKVIILPYAYGDHFPDGQNFVEIYDSDTASWSNVKVAETISYHFAALYVDGVIFFVNHDLLGSFVKVMSLNIKDKSLVKEPVTVAEVELAEVELRGEQIVTAYPATCDTNLLTILLSMRSGTKFVLKIHLGRKQLLGVSPGSPQYPLEAVDPVSDGDYIFDQVRSRGSGVLAYSVHADQWESLPYFTESDHLKMKIWENDPYWMPSSSFRPGLNPFVAV